eukprot:scaffold3451_cov116-Isochrysis_galbana.AAC.14
MIHTEEAASAERCGHASPAESRTARPCRSPASSARRAGERQGCACPRLLARTSATRSFCRSSSFARRKISRLSFLSLATLPFQKVILRSYRSSLSASCFFSSVLAFSTRPSSISAKNLPAVALAALAVAPSAQAPRTGTRSGVRSSASMPSKGGIFATASAAAEVRSATGFHSSGSCGSSGSCSSGSFGTDRSSGSCGSSTMCTACSLLRDAAGADGRAERNEAAAEDKRASNIARPEPPPRHL